MDKSSGSEVYSRFDNQNEIRLVHIDPATNIHDPINCKLVHHSLDHLPDSGYTALSYSWVGTPGEASISINGTSVTVTRSLETGLRRLRTDRILVLWADAVCINQSDNDERSEQTAKMRFIYQRAKAVCVWLGPESEDSHLAWDLIWSLKNHPPAQFPNLFRESELPKFEALKKLFRRPYWWRMWVVQEVTCGSKVSVYCGNESISWSDLSAICDIMEQRQDLLATIMYPGDPDSAFSLISGGPKKLSLSKFSKDKDPPLLDLLRTHKSKFSKDKRDKVYALVGLSNTRDSFEKLDYDRSVQDTYVHTARHIISTTRMLDVICVKQHDNNFENLPTWAPDWTRVGDYPQHRVVGLHHRDTRFSAAGTTLADVSFSEDGYSLQAKGFLVDSIIQQGASFHLEEGPPTNIVPVLTILKKWWSLFLETFTDSLDSRNLFLRAACGGDWTPKYEVPAPQRTELMFDLIKKELPSEDLQRSFGTQMQRSWFSGASLRMHGKRFAVSGSNKACLVPWATEVGDVICLLFGCSFPVILRRKLDHYVLIGEVYVDGIMLGEELKRFQDEGSEPDTFLIR